MRCEQWMRLPKGSPERGEKCREEATASFLWPGKDRQATCAMHTIRARAVATVMGFHLEIVSVELREKEIAFSVLAGLLPACLCGHRAHTETPCPFTACGCRVYRTACGCGHTKDAHAFFEGECKVCNCPKYDDL